MNYLQVMFLNTAEADSKDLTISKARFELKPPIQVPQASGLKIACHSFSFTNFFVNISAAIGNEIFYYTDDVLVPNKYTVTIDDGSYNVSELSEAINTGVINNGHADGLITLTPDFSTNKVLFSISAAGYQLYFPAGSAYVLLGCTLNQKIPAAALTVAAYSELAPNVATFNSILNLYLHTSLSNSSIYANGKQSDIIASVIPTADIGSIQETTPYNMLWIDASHLGGMMINTIDIYVTDQNGNSVELADDFSATVILAQSS